MVIMILDSVESVAFSDDGAYLATRSGDRTVNLIDMKNLKLIKTFEYMLASNQFIFIIQYTYTYMA